MGFWRTIIEIFKLSWEKAKRDQMLAAMSASEREKFLADEAAQHQKEFEASDLKCQMDAALAKMAEKMREDSQRDSR